MPTCKEPTGATAGDEFVMWNVKAGSRFGATARAVTNTQVPTNDYDAAIHIVQPGGSAVDWAKADLNPGPACLTLVEGGYGATAQLDSGPSGPTVTLHAWIEAPDGTTPFNNTWTNAAAGTESHIAIVLVVTA
ncbi:MAG: hypothetical protein ACRD3J_26590 [Thermoanaerobaculia bacterium]